MKYYVTTFCNFVHRLADGKPVDHECYVLPTAALVAEMEGDYPKALDILSTWKKRRPHKGLRSRPKEDAHENDR